MPDQETAAFLGGVPLFEGREEADLLALARLVRRRTVREGDVLWRQGDDARELVFVVEGELAASLRVGGDRSTEVARVGCGEVVGDIGVLGGAGHTTTIAATRDATVLALGRQDLAALLAGRSASAFTLKRRLAALLAARLRTQVGNLATWLEDAGGAPPPDRPQR